MLKGIHHVNGLLDEVETASKEQRILDSLRLLESAYTPPHISVLAGSLANVSRTESWQAIDQLGVSKSCRVMRLLDIRSFELKSDIHSVFDRQWKDLVQIDMGAGQVVIRDSSGGKLIPRHQDLTIMQVLTV